MERDFSFVLDNPVTVINIATKEEWTLTGYNTYGFPRLVRNGGIMHVNPQIYANYFEELKGIN